ncbi:DUF7504 family protein [Haloarchaeobius sp. DFWS5]|uniref:DUF7504 family protein n=1 Tax=Haloarchaeobius sp. DFWS5 TaxID=3446114 RepID=UPI003EBFB5D1
MDPERVAFERRLAGATFRDAAQTADFSSVLAEFKRQGCGMLVSGTVGEATHSQVFRLLGGAADADRKRIVVTESNQAEANRLLPSDVAPGDPDVRVLQVSDYVSLDGLRQAVLEAAVGFDTRAGGLGAGQCRLLVPDLKSVVDEGSLLDYEPFVRALATVIRGVRGMGYFHVHTDEVPPEFVEVFDGWIELREGATGAQHRWHVPRDELTTNWMRL